MKKNAIKHSQLLTKMNKLFLALVLGAIFAIIPSTTVMAFTIPLTSNGSTVQLGGMNINPGDTIVWTLDENPAIAPGTLTVNYHGTTGDILYPDSNNYSSDGEYPISDTIGSDIPNFHHWKVDSIGLNVETNVVSLDLITVLTTDGQPVTVTAEPEGAGNPTSGTNIVFEDEEGNFFDIMANPAAGYDFVRWELLTQNAELVDNNGNNTTFQKNTVFKYLGGEGEVNIKAVYQRKPDTGNSGSGSEAGGSSDDSVSSGAGVTNDEEPLHDDPNVLKTREDAGGASIDASGRSTADAGVVSTPQVVAGGKVYRSTVSGAFITQNIAIAVVAPAAELRTQAGLGAGEALYFKGWEFTAKKSPLAYQALTDVAGSIRGNVLQCVELNFGKMTFGKFAELDENVVSRTTISLPKKADKNKKHALARAAKGGKTQILENFTEDPNVITSDIPGGAAAYAIVEY